MAGHRILAYGYFLHLAVITCRLSYRLKRRQGSNVGETQLLQVRQLQAGYPLQNMAQRVGTLVPKAFGIRRFADTYTIKHYKSDPFK
ncbi:hypothetical protein D3C80_1782820 [compost metagenome]